MLAGEEGGSCNITPEPFAVCDLNLYKAIKLKSAVVINYLNNSNMKRYVTSWFRKDLLLGNKKEL